MAEDAIDTIREHELDTADAAVALDLRSLDLQRPPARRSSAGCGRFATPLEDYFRL